MALTPAKPSFFGSMGNAKFRVWYTPAWSASTAETFTVPGIKKVFSVLVAGPSTSFVSWTSSVAANGLGSVVSLQMGTASTGNVGPVMVTGY